MIQWLTWLVWYNRLTMIKVWKTLKYTYTLHSCIGNENGGKKLSLTDVTKSWFRLWDTSTSCKTLIFTNFSSVICHMSYRKGSLQRYLAGYLAIEFTLEIWKSQSVKRSKWNQAEDGPKLQVRFVWKPPCTEQGEKCSAIPWWIVEILQNCAAGQVCTGLKTWTKSFLRYMVQCEIAIVIRHKLLIT